MADGVDQILTRLRAAGGRVTASRMAVVDALVNGPAHHVTALDLVERLRRGDPNFHESTVYRTLDRLVALGEVTRIEVDGGAAVYHLAESAHHHVVCENCGRVVGVDADVLEPIARRLRHEHGFELRADAVTLPGRCVECDPQPHGGARGSAALSHDH